MARAWRRLVVPTVPLLLCAVTLSYAADAPAIRWKAGAERLPETTADQLRAVSADVVAGRRHVVVQFDHVLAADERAALVVRGIHVLRAIDGGAYFAALEPDLGGADAIARTPGLVGLAPVRSAWKLHPAITAGNLPPWAIVDGGAPNVRRVAVYVILHADVARSACDALLRTCDATVVSELRSINGLVVELPEAALATLAAADEVQWIEPPLPPLSMTNDGVRARTGADIVQAPPYGLSGAGITVMVYDGGGARPTHVDFQGRVTVVDGSPTIIHSTHVAGIIGGAGVANPLYRGMAPGVTMLSYGLQGAGSSSPLYNDPGDIETDFNDAINGGGAVLSNASLGSNVEANGFDCTWQGNYGVTDALIDAIVHGSLGAPFRAVWSAGNERYGTRCDIEGYGAYYSIAPPAGVKNHLSVGAVNSNDDSMTTFSSWGPTDDGRIKPDIVAPGCQSDGDHGVTSCSGYSDTEYLTMCGTSMSSPAVCGLSALVLQDFKAQFPNQPLPRNATLRALFAHTAVDLGNVGPDYQFGYGSVRINAAIDQLRSGHFGEATVDQGQSYTRTVVVPAGWPEFKLTLAWDDVPATPNANPVLVNDLDLVVTGPDGTRYYPWTLDPQNPANPAVQTQADHLNNIEQVRVSNPAAGEWTIAVVGTNVPEGPQVFSLVGDGAQNIATVIQLPNGLPDVVPPGVTRSLDVRITTFGESIVPGSAKLYYRVGGGAFSERPLVDLGGGLYRVALPSASCGQTPEYYVSVIGTEEGPVTLPANAPTTTFSHQIGAWATLFADDFEQPRGWTVFAGAYSGNWERADPQQVVSGTAITQPEDDHTPGTGHLCYVTGALAGSNPSANDVDGGPSHLISPPIDLAGRVAIVSYWRWYYMAVNLDDALVVAVSNDGTNWTTVENVTRSASEWIHAEWRLNDYITPGSSVQVRFTVNDTDPGSLIESLIDDFAIRAVTCTPPLLGDMNCDGDVDFADIDPFVAALSGQSGYELAYPDCVYSSADCNQDGAVDFADIDPFVALLSQ